MMATVESLFLVLMTFTFRIQLMVSENRVIQLYEQYPKLIGIVPVVASLFYAGILVTIISYQNMVGLQEEKKKYIVEQQQVHAIQKRMEQVEQFYGGIRRMKHEMKNHLTNIKDLYESGNFGETEQYIKRMDVFELERYEAARDGYEKASEEISDRQGEKF